MVRSADSQRPAYREGPMPETSSPGTSDHPGSADNEQTARALLDAFARFDLDTYESLIAEDAVERRPQTGDRFVGRAKIIGMYRHYPADPPVVTWERIRGSGTVFVAEGTIGKWLKKPGDHVFELFELLPDHRVSGRIRPGQLTQTGNPPQYGDRIERRRGSGGSHRALSSRAFSATCTRLGFQNLKRSPSSLVSVSSSPCTRD